MTPRRANVRGRGTESEASMRPNVSDRFWSKVDRSGECWLWTGARFQNRRGKRTYGMFLSGGRLHPAHRVAWELANGPIPDGLSVLHSCDNPPCVRIDHLRVGTHRDNMQDMRERGRAERGEAHHDHRFTVAQVRAIRGRLALGHCDSAIAREYGVNVASIRFIRTRRNWGWLDAA